MGQLKNALMMQHRRLPENKRPTVTMPPNLQEVKLKFSRRRSAKVMGRLADQQQQQDQMEMQEGEGVEGILVTQNFNSKILAPEDLKTYTPLRLGSVKSKLHVPFSGSVDALRLFLKEMFAGLEEDKDKDKDEDEEQYQVDSEDGITSTAAKTEVATDATSTPDHDNKSLKVHTFSLHNKEIILTTGKTIGIATVEWKASPVNDILADSVIALLMHAQSSAATIQLTSKPCIHRSRPENDGDDTGSGSDSDSDQPIRKRQKVDNLLRMFHNTLLQQFDDDKIEATYEARRATFEIKTDAGLESGSLGEGEELVCHVLVEFGEEGMYDAMEAKITVECEDQKFGRNIQDCLKGVKDAAGPVKVL